MGVVPETDASPFKTCGDIVPVHAVISVGCVGSQWEAGKSTQLQARERFLPLRTHIAHRRDDLKQANHAWMGELTQDLHFPYRRNRELA